jgi:lipoyl(octanoyl) transferase
MRDRQNLRPVEWHRSTAPVGYAEAVRAMEARADAIAEGRAAELVWLLEHPALYTAGTSAKPQDLLDPDRFPVHRSGRGGQYTYHGPGQRIMYLMLDVGRRSRDVRAYVAALEGLIIDTLAVFGVKGEIRCGRVGVWVPRPELGPEREDKIAAIGLRLRRWISFHGLALNVAPDLEHFSGIVPCGVEMHGVTSLADLGKTASMNDVDRALKAAFESRFGPTQPVAAIDEPASAQVG